VPFSTIMTPSMRCTIGASYKGLIYVITGTEGIGLTRPYQRPMPRAWFAWSVTRVSRVDRHSPGNDILAGQWSSPLVAEINGQAQLIAPQGDGWIRSFRRDHRKTHLEMRRQPERLKPLDDA